MKNKKRKTKNKKKIKTNKEKRTRNSLECVLKTGKATRSHRIEGRKVSFPAAGRR